MPQNSLKVFDRMGCDMIGLAEIPIVCQNKAIRWKVPKCNRKIKPKRPIHPRSRGSCSGTRRATTHSDITPRAVFRAAQSHCRRLGLTERSSGSRKVFASIPGQATRYARERPRQCTACGQACHHVIHLRPAKMANDRAHMNNQGCIWVRRAITIAGKTTSGSVPIHRLLFSAGFGEVETEANGILVNSGGINLQFNEEATQLADEAPNAANLRATAILDHVEPFICELATEFRRQHSQDREMLQAAHRYLVDFVKPVYTLNELQPASHTLRKRLGSCSQRIACLEAVSRAAGVATRSRALGVSGRFWYPRFRGLSMFIPKRILLVWPQFRCKGAWVDFDELYGSLVDLAKRANHEFWNEGESVFDAVVHTPVGFLAKTCRGGCSSSFDLSRFVLADEGFFDTRDEVFEHFGSFQSTIRGRAFEMLFGGRKSA